MNHSAVVCMCARCFAQSIRPLRSCFDSCAKSACHPESQKAFVCIHDDISIHVATHSSHGLVSSSSPILEQGIRMLSMPSPSKQSAVSTARISGSSIAQIWAGASGAKCRLDFLASLLTIAWCTARGMAPLYPVLSPSRYALTSVRSGRQSTDSRSLFPWVSITRVAMPPHRACALTSPSTACMMSMARCAHRVRSSGLKPVRALKNCDVGWNRACTRVKSPVAFASSSARSSAVTARANRSGSSDAALEATAGSRWVVHTHLVSHHSPCVDIPPARRVNSLCRRLLGTPVTKLT